MHVRRSFIIASAAAVAASLVSARAHVPVNAQQPSATAVALGAFTFAYDERGVSLLGHRQDPFGALLTTGPGQGRGGRGQTPPATLGLTVAYRTAPTAEWTLAPRGASMTADPGKGVVSYSNAGSGDPLTITETYRTDGRVLDWTVDVQARRGPITIGDLGITVPIQGPSGQTPEQIFERGFLKHQFVSGHGSFMYFVRASGAPPFLLVTTLPGTSLEYTATTGSGARPGPQVYVHSARSGGAETRGTWRQAHTQRDLRQGDRAQYGFRFQWASSYDELRELLYQSGHFDVRVAPGMTVPSDLTARVALRTKARIESIRPEFPGETTVRRLESPQPDTQLYDVSFRRLGENMLTIVHDGGRETHLEFFATEPMETLIRKRASFLVERQQIKDPSKWWNGVYAIYDMSRSTVRTIDDPDIFVDRMAYALTADDPGLAKAPYLAAKNVAFPDKREIESLEYYLEHFVWGGLQRKDDERPYPYGIYGTPHWFINRDPGRRKAYADSLANNATAIRDLAREHVWRSYDYPHIVMLYFHMYQIAKLYPELSTYLDASGYLNRAWETARAFYIYPYEIYPDYYETYKWGLYNELVVLELIKALEQEGFREQASWLRGQWEIKTKYFVYDDKYPFRSEYAFDRTAFESTYAFAKYGATTDMAPDQNLWYDVKQKKWYSHPQVRREDSRAFMDRQLASGLAVRGWLNPAYYTLGADPGVSYMAAMGGWGVLDYAINFAPVPYDWLQLGYASYLSSWALMNTGTADSGYGFWFKGQQNDGAAGWQFMSTKVGSAWMGSSVPGGVTVPRGPWHYDGEIDLGFGGALRMATTLLTRDPAFGWFAYGGALDESDEALQIEPRDGLRKRFTVVLPDRGLPFADSVSRVKIELERDGFAAGRRIEVAKDLSRVAFEMESRTPGDHHTGILLSWSPGVRYEVRHNGVVVPLTATGDWDYPWRAAVLVNAGATRIEIVRR